ncbi:hypothetical protein [Rhizobium leguminosarum]
MAVTPPVANGTAEVIRHGLTGFSVSPKLPWLLMIWIGRSALGACCLHGYPVPLPSPHLTVRYPAYPISDAAVADIATNRSGIEAKRSSLSRKQRPCRRQGR